MSSVDRDSRRGEELSAMDNNFSSNRRSVDNSDTAAGSQQNSRFSQIYTSLCVNLLSFSWGTSVGWFSSVFELLKSDDSPLPSGPLSIQETSIVGSLGMAGGIISTICYGWITQKYGRKRALISCAIPYMVGWLLVYLATNATHLMISRLLHGIASGGAFIVIPIFITEIAEKSIRGLLGALLIISMNIGTLVGYVIGDIVSWDMQPLILATFSYLFLGGVFIIHESPTYLLQNSRFRRAENALKFYRGCPAGKEMNDRVRRELEEMTCSIKISNCDSSKGKITLNSFFSRPVSKSLLIGLVLMTFDLLSGRFPLINYASLIFVESGKSALSSNQSAMVVGGIQLIGNVVSLSLVERLGRKKLLMMSGLNCALGLTMLAVYDYSQHHGVDVTKYNWIPLFSVCFVILSANLGFTSLPFLILSEIASNKLILSICITHSWTVAFLCMQFLPTAILMLGLNGTLFIFAILCIAGALFVRVFVPETKNKSIEEIQEIMSK